MFSVLNKHHRLLHKNTLQTYKALLFKFNLRYIDFLMCMKNNNYYSLLYFLSVTFLKPVDLFHLTDVMW